MQTEYVDEDDFEKKIFFFFEDILVCINHIDQLCSCSPRKYCLWYRYTLDEMSDMLEALRERLDLCQKWKLLVNRVISSDHQTLIGKRTNNTKYSIFIH